MDTDTAWELWGQRDPYFGVLTDPRFRAADLTPDAVDHFFAIGRHHVDHVVAVCRRHLAPEFTPRRVLDFGCGVGRLVVPFAAFADEVVGMDIAPSMLAEARRNCDRLRARNVSLVLSDDALSQAEGKFDFVHSCIVLQHIEVARGRELFTQLVRRVASGGCGALHVTFGWDLHAGTFGAPPPPMLEPPPSPLAHGKRKVRDLLQRVGASAVEPPAPLPAVEAVGDPEMQMHYYNLSDLTFVLQRAGIDAIYTELTDHGGALGAFLYFRRP